MKYLFLLITFIFLWCPIFSQNLFLYLENDKWGYINIDGEVVIKAKYLRANNFKNGIAKVLIAEEKGAYIDSTGKKLIHYFPYYDTDEKHYYSEDLIAIPNKKGYFGFKNLKNKWVIPPKYYQVNNFSEGLAAVCGAPQYITDVGSDCDQALDIRILHLSIH